MVIKQQRQYLLGVVIIIVFAITFFAIVPQLSTFKTSLQTVHHAAGSYVAAAFLLALASYVLGALCYQALSLRPIRFSDTLLVQLAGLLVNRVLPGGIGGLGLNFLYLRGHKHSNIQAGAVAGINNIMGSVGNILLLGLGAVLFPASVASVVHVYKRPSLSSLQLVITTIILIALVLLVLVFRTKLRSRFKQLRLQLGTVLIHYRRRPYKLLLGLVFACALTLCNVASLWLSCRATDINLSFIVIFIIFSFGILLGTAVPSPGGLGGTEAALVAGLVSQHVPAAQALGGVLVFRLVTFWIGLIIGAGALPIVRHRQLLATSR